VNEFNSRLSGTTFLKDVLTTSIERKLNSTNNFQIQTFNIKASFVEGKQLLDYGASEMEHIPEKIPDASVSAPDSAQGGQ
jgi:hypothetical protein